METEEVSPWSGSEGGGSRSRASGVELDGRWLKLHNRGGQERAGEEADAGARGESGHSVRDGKVCVCVRQGRGGGGSHRSSTADGE